MDWQREAKAFIAKIDASLPADATLADRKKAIRARAWEYTGGTSWGKRTLAKHARAYYEMHGQPPRKGQSAHMFPADIAFPFRGDAR